MIRIDEKTVFDCKENIFYINKFININSKYSMMKAVWLILFLVEISLSLSLLAGIEAFNLDISMKIFLTLIIFLGVPFIAVSIYKLTGLIKTLHMGELIVLMRGAGLDYKEKIMEKAEEDKFIYVFENKSHLNIKVNEKPKLLSKEITYQQILINIREKKSLILHYSLFMNLFSLGAIIFISVLMIAPVEYPLSILPIFIPIFLYWIILTTFGYSPIKSYRFWTKLEKHIENFKVIECSLKTPTPIMDYEKIHKKVLEEKNNLRQEE